MGAKLEELHKNNELNKVRRVKRKYQLQGKEKMLDF